MKSNLIKNVLFSVSLHGILLACCLAMPAQKLIPLFQAGNSSLTLTSLSISRPAEEQSKALSIQKQPAGNDFGAEIENDEENIQDASPAIPVKKSAPDSSPNPKNQNAPIDADAQAKGISAGLAGASAIRPYYPLGARWRGEEGVVKVEVCVGSNGQVLNCAVAKSSGFSALDDAALAAVKHAHFVSAKSLAIKDGSRTILTFRFDLID